MLTVLICNALARVDHITEAASFWNSRKIRALPFSLSIRLTKVHTYTLVCTAYSSYQMYLLILQTRQLLQQTQFELQLLQPKFDVLLSESVLESFKRNLKSIAQCTLVKFVAYVHMYKLHIHYS